MTTRANTMTQVRALLWEELRVGGAIAGLCLVVGLLMIGQSYATYGSAAWTRDEFLAGLGVLGIPLTVGLLLILNPNSSGHLVGGFSKRILRLPVQTPVAVAVSLFARMAMVYAVASITIGVSSLIFNEAPGYGTVCFVTLVYIAAQLIDWLRGPVRGLTSLVAVVLAILVLQWLFADQPLLSEERAQRAAQLPLSALLAVAILIPAAAYGISARMVHADRIGRRYGIPEIWEWPGLFSPSRAAVNMKPFRSPLAAQVWFELRRSKFLLPLSVALIYVIVLAASWFVFLEDKDRSRYQSAIQFFSGVMIFIPVLLGAAIHGAHTRVMGFRREIRSVGYEYLLPASSEGHAAARAIAALALLLPTLGVALAFHFLVGGWQFLAETVPQALDSGYISLKEVLWIVLGRAFPVVLLAAPLLALGTRTFRRLVFAALLLAVAISLFELDWWATDLINDIVTDQSRSTRYSTATICFLGVALVAMLALAIRRRMLSRRGFACLALVWAASAWLMHYVMVSAWAPDPLTALQHVSAIALALGAGSLVPIAFLAVLFDVYRRRGLAWGTQIANDSSSPIAKWSPSRIATATALVAFVVWMGWPSMPAAVTWLRAKGYPVTYADLRQWYPKPEGPNLADQYLQIGKEQKSMANKLDEFTNKAATTLIVREHNPRGKYTTYPPLTHHYDSYPFIVGGGEWKPYEPLDRRSWLATELYWNRVSSRIAPQLQEAAQQDTARTHFILNVEAGPAVELSHLAMVRTLARELSVDALHWTIASQPSKAVSSIEANFALSKTFTNEPYIISQLVRLAVIGIARESIVNLVNRSATLGDADFARLQQACEQALPPLTQGMALDRAIIAEGATAPFGALHYFVGAVNKDGKVDTVKAPMVAVMLYQLGFPVGATRMAMLFEIEDTLRTRLLPWPEAQAAQERRDQRLEANLQFMGPLVAILWPSIGRTYESEWRTRTELDVTRVALAVERYRLAHGSLPKSLDELVPRFIAAIPDDYYAGRGIPLRYRQKEGGGFVVYSLSRNQTDENGEAFDEKEQDYYRYYWEGDITFTVAPMSFRSGPQIARN